MTGSVAGNGSACPCGSGAGGCQCDTGLGDTAPARSDWRPPGFSRAPGHRFTGPYIGNQATVETGHASLQPPYGPMPSSNTQPIAPLVPGSRGGAGGNDGGPRNGITVEGKECDRVIKLAVAIRVGDRGLPKGAIAMAIAAAKYTTALRLLQRANALLERMGPWECCPNTTPGCKVKLAIEVTTQAAAERSKKTAPVTARFYADNKERVHLIGDKREDPFGRTTMSTGAMTLPLMTLTHAADPHAVGGLGGLEESAVPTPIPIPPHSGALVAWTQQGVSLGHAYDVLAVIIHEILHSMGAEHNEEPANTMNANLGLGAEGAFRVTTATACQIAAKNNVCVGEERNHCCKVQTTNPKGTGGGLKRAVVSQYAGGVAGLLGGVMVEAGAAFLPGQPIGIQTSLLYERPYEKPS